MRFTTLVAALPALALAQEQVPLADRVQGWFNKAKAYVPTAVPADPIMKMAEKVSGKSVTPVTMQNWQDILTPATRAQDWLIFVTGGQKTCFARCEHAETAFNESTLLFAADPTSPHLGLLNCEAERPLCATWSAGAPSVYYFQVPKAQPAGAERLPTPLHVIYMNSTTVTPEEIYQIHSKKNFKKDPAYEGLMHPIDGFFAQNQLLIPIGYAIYALGAIPGWMFMIGISFVSRTLMSRRMGNINNRRAEAPAAPAAPAAGGGN